MFKETTKRICPQWRTQFVWGAGAKKIKRASAVYGGAPACRRLGCIDGITVTNPAVVGLDVITTSYTSVIKTNRKLLTI